MRFELLKSYSYSFHLQYKKFKTGGGEYVQEGCENLYVSNLRELSKGKRVSFAKRCQSDRPRSFQKPAKRNEQILKLMTRAPGEMRGPVIVVENDKVVLGYNREKLEEFIP